MTQSTMHPSVPLGRAKTLPRVASALLRLRGRSLFFSIVTLSCFGFLPASDALLPSPPPDGGYPGHNTAEGTNALQKLTTGTDNTALGFQALSGNENGSFNTSNVSFPFYQSPSGQQNTTTV